MNQQVDQLTVEQLAAMLADAKRLDGSYVFNSAVREPACKKVGIRPHWHFDLYYSAKADCKQGYTPSMSLEVWLAAICKGFGYVQIMHPYESYQWQAHVKRTGHMDRIPHSGTGEAPLEALLRALVAALEAQGVKICGIM